MMSERCQEHRLGEPYGGTSSGNETETQHTIQLWVSVQKDLEPDLKELRAHLCLS